MATIFGLLRMRAGPPLKAGFAVRIEWPDGAHTLGRRTPNYWTAFRRARRQQMMMRLGPRARFDVVFVTAAQAARYSGPCRDAGCGL